LIVTGLNLRGCLKFRLAQAFCAKFAQNAVYTQVIPQGGKTGSKGSAKVKDGRFGRFLLKTPGKMEF
jgi:hypothetical protein